MQLKLRALLFGLSLTASICSHAQQQTDKTAEQAAETALKVGDKAIDGELVDASGEKVKLSDLWKDGPLVVIWYRGGWCPVCQKHLSGIQEALPEIKAAGGQIVAIAPELPENSKQTAEKSGLEFPVLSDKGNELGKKYGVIFKLDPETAKKYQDWINLEKYNGDASMQLPIPVAYIINTEGVITFAFVNANYGERVKPADVVTALKSLHAG